MVRLLCSPCGIDGPVNVPGLGLFAPGVVAVVDDATAVLLKATGHFVDAPANAHRRRPLPRLEE